MIKYNNSNINDWNFGDDNIIKVYRNNAVCYYKITGGGDTPTAQTPCYAVVDNISQYSDTEFEDVYDKATEKWYKLNNLNQFEEYGVYGDSISSGSSRLPQGYTEVEYIENTSQAYINLGINPTNAIGNSFTIETKFNSSPYGSDFEYIFSNEQGDASPYYGFGLRWYQRNMQVMTSDETNYTSALTQNSDSTSSFTLSVSSASRSNTTPITLFCGLRGSTVWRNGRGKFYSVKVTINNSLVRNMIPCKRDNDNMVGMYDIVNDVFYYPPNYTSYQLVAGSAVTSTAATYYQGKLAIVDGYEYQYSGNSWVNLGEVSGSSKTSGFTIDDISNDVTVKSSISDGDYYVISFYKHNNPKEPQYMMSYRKSDNYLNNFSGHTGSNSITPSTVIDAAIWKFEATSTANTYYIKNIYNNLYWGYQTRASNRSLNLVADSSSSKAIVKVGVANSATTVGFVELNVNGSSYTYEDGTVGGYALNQLNGYTYTLNWWNTEGWGSDGNSAYYLYKIEGGTIVYPVEYDEMQDPPDNLTFNTMAEAEAYECPWVGMQAIIDGDKYIFSGDSISGYEWVYQPPSACEYNFCGVDANGNDVIINNGTTTLTQSNWTSPYPVEGMVGDATITIGMYCFQNIKGTLSALTIGSTVTTIEHEAFMETSLLTTLTIPSSVTQIDFWAFTRCNGLNEVIFEGTTPPTFTNQNSGVFHDYCPPVIYVPDSAVSAYRAIDGSVWTNQSWSTNIIQPISNR